MLLSGASVLCRAASALTDVHWQVVLHYAPPPPPPLTPLRDDIIAVAVVTLHYGASQGDCAREESNLLRHSLPFPPASEERGDGGGVGGEREGRNVHVFVEGLRGRVLGEGIRSIVLPPCPSAGDRGSRLTAPRCKRGKSKTGTEGHFFIF